jgi:hypothetical protein
VLNDIQWITQKQSYLFYEENYRPKKLDMENAVWLEVGNRDDWRFLPGAGTEVQIDGLGSFQQWYGLLDDELFIVSRSHSYCDYVDIQLPISVYEPTDSWSPAKVVAVLSEDLVSKIRWIRSTGTGAYTLFVKPNDVIEYLFCNTSQSNANVLKKFLEQHGFYLNMTIALSENFFCDWTGYKAKAEGEEFLCRYQDRGSVERFVKTQQIKTPEASFKISPNEILNECRWRLMRQDDNNNEIEVASFSNQVDAKFAQIDYEKRGHKQIYWVERAK